MSSLIKERKSREGSCEEIFFFTVLALLCFLPLNMVEVTGGAAAILGP